MALLCACAAWAAYAPVLQAEFVRYDDYDLLVENAAFRASGGPSLRWMLSTTLLGHWDPLTWLSLALDQALYGFDARAFHRTNLALHALDAALVCVLAFRLLSIARPRAASERPTALVVAAAGAALFFAVHPLRAESVAWVTERRGLLGASFFLLALLAYLRAVAPGRTAVASKGWYAASIVGLLLSLLSKGLAMTMFAVLLVIDVYPLRRLPAAGATAGERWFGSAARRVWLQKLPYVLLGAASAVVSNWAARSIPLTIETSEKWGPAARIGQSFFGLAYYVRKTVLPRGLAAVVELPYRFDPLEPRFLLSAIAVTLAALAIFLARRRAPALVAATLVYGISIAPVLGLAQAGPQLVADRYSYVACLPWALLAAGALLSAWRRFAKPLARALVAGSAAAVLAALFVGARAQAQVWHDSRALWSHAIAVGEESAIAHTNLGALAAAAGDERGAAEHFESAIRVRPDQGQAWFNLGILRARAGRWDEAERAYLEACEHVVPAYLPLVNLGYLYLDRLGRPEDAIACFRKAVADVEKLPPHMFSAVPYQALSTVLERNGDVAQARELREAAARGESRRLGAASPGR